MLSLLILFLAAGVPGLALYFWASRKYFREAGMIIGGGYALIIALVYISCVTRVNPGEVGIVVNMLGDTGVDAHERHVGIHFLWPWQTINLFPIYEQNHQWIGDEGFNFQTIEGLSVHADIGITFNLTQDKVHDLFWRYRRGIEEITHTFIRNNIRDAVNRLSSKMKIEELYGDKKEEFFMNVQKQVQAETRELGFNISHLYIIGQFKVPPMVMEALNRKIEAIQKAQQRENELREAEAEARKEIAKADGEAKSKLLRAKADADAIYMNAEAQANANRLLTQSLSSDLIKWETVNKWNGELPRITGKDGMMIQLPLQDKLQ